MFFLFSTGKTLVNRSARFSEDFWKNTLIIPAAKSLRHQWNAMKTCFFLRAASGFTDDFTTNSLSQKTLVGPSNGTPIIRNLYRKPIINSVPIFKATYSEPKVDVSTVFYLVEYHKIGAMLQKINIPVWDLLVTLFPAWSASICALFCTLLPNGSGISNKISSFPSLYKVFIIFFSLMDVHYLHHASLCQAFQDRECGKSSYRQFFTLIITHCVIS